MGKKKIESKKKVDAGAAQSKTARASMAKGKGKQEGFIAAAPEHLDRFISLGGGSYCYFLDPRNGKTHHLAVGSEKYFDFMIEALSTNHGAQIRAEMERKDLPFPAEFVAVN